MYLRTHTHISIIKDKEVMNLRAGGACIEIEGEKEKVRNYGIVL